MLKLDAPVRDVTDAEVAHYQRDGWVHLPRLIDPLIAAEMVVKGKELMGESGTEAALREFDVDFDRWHDYHYPAREGVQPFKNISYSEAMGRAAQRFNERKIGMRAWSDMIAVKPPAGSTPRSGDTPFHQDYPNRHFDRVGSLTFWIALEDMPPERGTMRFRSGSHKAGSLGWDFGPGTGKDVHDTYPFIEERYPQSPPLAMKAGDATCHHQLMLHMAPRNTTQQSRWTYITMYFPEDTLWTGCEFHGPGAEDLTRGQPFDHPNFPVVTR